MSAVEVRGVTKSFGADPVLDDVSVTVSDGATLSLLGPSGSGKSTLLRIVAGLERPDRGSVHVGGHDITHRPVHQRGVGLVFQDQALFPHLDVAGNVGFGLRMAGSPRAGRRRRVADALAMVGLPGYGHRDPATLSGGEAQRVALARALAPRPQVVLLDEPLAALDQLLRERLLVELRQLFVELSVTVIAVTHDPTEAGALGDRLAVLLDGRLAQVDLPGAVVARPVSPAVAGLVGHRNLVVGEVEAGMARTPWGDFAVDHEDGRVTVLVPPDAVVPDPDGSMHGTVVSRVFRGGSGFAVIDPGHGPVLDVRAEPEWNVGDRVRLGVDCTAVHVMTGS